MPQMDSPLDTIIIGTGGMGREVLWLIREHNASGRRPLRPVGFVSSDASDHGRSIQGVPVLGDERRILEYADVRVVCAIGDSRARRLVCRRLSDEGVRFASVIHPSVFMSDQVEIGQGSIISANVVLTTDIRTGKHVIVNVNASVSHDSVLEDFVTLAPGVNVPGHVTIGYGSDLGVNSSVLPGCHIGRGVVVGAGAVVTRDLEANCVAMGVPARVSRRLPESEWL